MVEITETKHIKEVCTSLFKNLLKRLKKEIVKHCNY
ncbi:hypothetical protein NPD8_3821 (plasmid) [Clostridium botulinum]|uniref:Uncharacterized protein n=1 Tax=Clostridium botulinum TaxID=1491 RepID=A0A1L7JME7_CLOBO|nr:hypothetical protein NPD8_3821 [Clostridium botulinum]